MNQPDLFMPKPSGFDRWLAENRHIYRKFVALALQAKDRGMEHWSARAVIQVMRWRMQIRERGDAQFKINNNYTPGLARLAMQQYPQLEGFFRCRDSLGRDQRS